MKTQITFALVVAIAAFGAAQGASLRGVPSLPLMPGPVIMNPETASVFGPQNAVCGCICPRDTCDAMYKCTKEARYLQLASCNTHAKASTVPQPALAPRDECTKDSDCGPHQFCLLSSIMINPNVCVDRPTQHRARALLSARGDRPRKLFAFWKKKTWTDAGKDIVSGADAVATGVETAAKDTYNDVIKPAGEGIATAAKDTAKGVVAAGDWIAHAGETVYNKGLKPIGEGIAMGAVYTACKFEKGWATLVGNKAAVADNAQCMNAIQKTCNTQFNSCNALVGCAMSKLGTTDPCAVTIANTVSLLPTLINPNPLNVMTIPGATQCIAAQMTTCAAQHGEGTVPHSRQLSSTTTTSKKCGNAAGEAACIAACASVVGMPLCLSDECYGPNGPDFSPSCKASTK